MKESDYSNNSNRPLAEMIQTHENRSTSNSHNQSIAELDHHAAYESPNPLQLSKNVSYHYQNNDLKPQNFDTPRSQIKRQQEQKMFK